MKGRSEDGAARRGASDAAAAFSVELEQHRVRLHRLAVLLTGDEHAAEEALADVCAKVFERWQAGRVDDLGAYLHRSLVNETAGRWRRARLRRREEQRHTVRPDGDHPDRSVVEREVVLAALRQLPPRQRAVLVLRFFDDRSEADTARILGIGVGTVKSSQSRALATLRDVWHEEEP